MIDVDFPKTLYGAKLKVLKKDFKRVQGKVLLQFSKEGRKYYEVHIIREFKGTFDKEPRYQMATPEDFGTYAWFYTDKHQALQKYASCL